MIAAARNPFQSRKLLESNPLAACSVAKIALTELMPCGERADQPRRQMLVELQLQQSFGIIAGCRQSAPVIRSAAIVRSFVETGFDAHNY